jgi:hypothetical protein
MYSSKIQFSKTQPQNQTTTAAQASTGQETVNIKMLGLKKVIKKFQKYILHIKPKD